MRRLLLLALIAIPFLGDARAQATYVYTDLGALPVETQTVAGVTGCVTETLTQSQAYGISPTGQVVGTEWINASNRTTSVTVQREFSYFGGTTTSIGVYNDGNNSIGYGINAAGQIVGIADEQGAANEVGFRYTGGSFLAIPATIYGGASNGYAINAAGNVAGQAEEEIPVGPNNNIITEKAILWEGGNPIILRDLTPTTINTTTEASLESSGQAINSGNIVAGWSDVVDSGETTIHACVMTRTAVLDLGTLPGCLNPDAESEAFGINNVGIVCGWSTAAPGTFLHAFIVSDNQPTGSMQDLGVVQNVSGGRMSEAFGINNSNTTVGQGDEEDGAITAAVVWPNGSPNTGMDLNLLTSGAGNWFMQSANAINDSGQIVGTAVYYNTTDVADPLNGVVHGFLLTPIAEATPPSVSVPPADFQTLVGNNIILASNITGSSPLTYQWYSNGAPISGATGANLTLTNVQVSSSANYSVIATNLVGVATTNVTMSVILPQPVFATQPANATVSVGDIAQFSVAATGSPTPTYQWQVLPSGSSNWVTLTDNATYTGSATSTLSVAAASALNGAQFACVATNGFSPNATSQAASLTVYPAGYVEWAAGLALTGNNALPTATSFGGTLPNLVRFAMNIGAVPSAGQLPALSTQVVNGTAYLLLDYNVSKSLSGLQVIVQYSYDLQTWQTLSNSDIVQLADLNPQTSQFQASIAIPASGEVFLHLVVQSQ